MFAMTRLRLLVVFIVWLAFAAVLALAAFSINASADHSWSTYHWKHAGTPHEVQLGDNVGASATDNWDTYLQTTAGVNDSDTYNDWDLNYETWSDYTYPDMLNTPIVTGQASSTKRCNPDTGRVEVCNARYGRTGWLGVAGIYVSDSHITKGYAKLNDTYFDTKTYNTPAWRNLVMCQEVGHIYGLDHQDEDHYNGNLGSCMDYTSSPDSNQYPNKHDYQQLETIYAGHNHSTSTTSSSSASKMPAAADQIDTNNPREWGKLVRRSSDGRYETYERNFGGGNKMITFVIWADREDQPQQKNQDQ